MINKFGRYLVVFAWLGWLGLSSGVLGGVVINEFMASNGTTLPDEDGDYEDWIELYNNSDEAVDLEGWGLSDNPNSPFKWRFPEGIEIDAHGYLLVWASGKERQTLPGESIVGIQREVWTGIPGTSIAELVGHPDYPSNPSSRNLVTDVFEAPTDVDDQYGQRMHGIFTAPETGMYRFWIASDDNGMLLLSSNENPANVVQIASVPGWTPPRQWDVYASQQSGLVSLVAGNEYYLAALMKEHGGGDNLAVRWQLPSGAIEEPIPAHYFRTPSVGQLHTNFRIAASGEPLLLTRPDGELADFVDAVPVPRDVTYGRQPDGADAWFYFKTATPGEANTETSVTFPPTVAFSEPRGFKTEPFQVTITASEVGAVIRYTLDGSEPGEGSPIYTEPLSIAGTTTLRASAVESDHIPIPPQTVTYLFLDDILQQGSSTPPGWPADRAVNNHRMEYGLRQAIVNGDNARLRQGMTAIPSISLVTDLDHLFHPQTGIYSNSNRSHGWERPVSIEVIDPNRGGEGEFHIDGGMRLRGAFSRSVSNPKHSFRLFFRADYGQSRLLFPLFEDEGASEFHKVDLRTAQNYSWSFDNNNRNTFLRDVFSRDSQRDLGMPYTRSRYYHLYLNGQYWGLYMTQERGESDYAATYFGGDADDWDTIKTSQPGYTTQASDGNFNAFFAFHEIAITQGFTGANSNNYWRVRGLNPDGTRNPELPIYLDEDNLINYMLVAHLTGDPDSPVSIWGGFPNNMYGLYNRNNPTGFKWLRHDAEHSLGAHGSYGVQSDTTQAGAGFTGRSQFNPSTLHIRLMQHPEYRTRFADLAQKHLYGNGALTPEKSIARVQQRMSEIDLAIIGESARWGRGRTRDGTWIPASNEVLSYLDRRRDILVRIYRNHGWLPEMDAPQFARTENSIRIHAQAPFYYTLDGTDPRLAGGGVNPAARRVDPNGEVPVPTTLISRGSSWKFFDRGSAPPVMGGRTWLEADYPDDDWGSGPAVLGFPGATVANPVATTTRRWVSGNSGPQVTTTYFRHTFDLDEVPQVSGFLMELLRDDGAIIYLNGVEILRDNMPLGPVTYATFAPNVVGSPDQNTYFTFESDHAQLLRPGTNILAAQVHQCNEGSSDLYFDFSMTTRVHGDFYVDLPAPMGVALKARAFNGSDWSAIVEASTLDDLPEGIVVHKWEFEEETDYLAPSFTWGNAALAVLPGATTEVVRNPAAQGFDSAHLRVNEPLGATVLFEIPTTGFEHIRVSYRTRRSGQGAGQQTAEYTVDGTEWIPLETYAVANADPQIRVFHLAPIEAVNDNPQFALRITFAEADGGDAGNNRFDDVTVTGFALPGTNLPPEVASPLADQAVVEVGTPLVFDLNTVFSDPDGDLLTYQVDVSDSTVIGVSITDAELTLTPEYRGEAEVVVRAFDGNHLPVQLTFRVLVYPEAYRLAEGVFAWDAWAADASRGSFPFHMLFLQGEDDDTGLETELSRAYHIPEDDAADPEDADFPYRAEFRTRINGLDADGISFINTGRGRDLGGALLAVDTREVSAVPIAWLGGTLLPNEREYAIRLQYRVGWEGSFQDVLNPDGAPIEYIRNDSVGHTEILTHGELPEEALGRPYVQLLWRYYRVDGDSGPRAQLRLDDIRVGNAPAEAATRLAFAEDLPVSWQSGQQLPPFTVLAVDAQGFPDYSFNGTVTLAAIGGAQLGGTQSLQAVQGSAVFRDLTLTGTGSFRLLASADTLATAEAGPLDFVEDPLFVRGGDGDWTEDANWTSALYPDGPGARARFREPSLGDREVTLRAPVVVGAITVENQETPFRNRIRSAGAESTLTFSAPEGPATLTVEGSGSGWVELDVSAGTVLQSDLRVSVHHMEGNMSDGFGALRLRQQWTGPGGLIKDGSGVLSMTGEGKDYIGATVVELGTLSVTEPATPRNTASVRVQPGGQLRLVSAGEPRLYAFGGDLILNSAGRGGEVIEGDGEGVLGALRYEPSSEGNRAEVLNDIVLEGFSGLHVSHASNELELRGRFSGEGAVQKSGGGRLILSGDSSGYEAPVSVHTGELRVNGILDSTLSVIQGAILRGSGRVGAVAGAGHVIPGPGGTALTTGSLADGMDLWIRLDAHGAGSMLRLAGSLPFGGGLTSLSRIHVLLSETPASGQVLDGGLFTDNAGDFLEAIEQAQWFVYVPDETGAVEIDDVSYGSRDGLISYAISTVPAVRSFDDGQISGRVLRMTVGAAFAQLGLVSIEPNSEGDWEVSFEIAADVGEEILLETSTDLNEWFVAEQVIGTGWDNPVTVSVELESVETLRFWRLRRASAP